MTYETLTFEVQDEIGIIRLNRPDARNALDLQMREDLSEVVHQLRRERTTKAVVFTGNGGAFCAGGDLRSLQGTQLTTLGGRDRIEAVHPWLFQLINLEKPVIAAVDGPAFGAGCNLALASDFVLATPRASFCQVFGRIGLVPDLAGFFLLPRIVGLQKAKELIFSARVVKADEAKALGIVYEIVPEVCLMERALELAGRFRHASLTAIGLSKRALNQSFHLDYHALSQLEAYAQALCIDSEYHKEAVARFNRKEQLAFDWDRLERKKAE